jgi:hypothetical protein
MDDGWGTPCNGDILVDAWHHGSTTAPRIPPSNSFRGEECPVPVLYAVDASHHFLRHAPSNELFGLLCSPSAPQAPRDATSLLYLWLKGASPLVASHPTLLLVLRGKKARAERRVTCGRVAISSSAGSRSVTGHGDTRTRECDHLKLDRSLVKRPLHLYLAEPPSFTPVETPIESSPKPVAEFNF